MSTTCSRASAGIAFGDNLRAICSAGAIINPDDDFRALMIENFPDGEAALAKASVFQADSAGLIESQAGDPEWTDFIQRTRISDPCREHEAHDR